MDSTNSQCRIVLIDDDPVCHFISEKMIKRFSSHDVEAFTHAGKALEQLQWRADNAPDQLPDYILLDLNMPFMDGWQFLEAFVAMPDHVAERTQVFILTSSDHHTDIEKAKRFRVVKGFFSKPLTENIVKLIGKCAA